MGFLPIHDFNDLYRSHYAALCYFSLKIVGDKMIAEDVVEDVFVSLLNSKRAFSETDNLKSWLYTATKNTSLNYLKREQHLKERQLHFSSHQPDYESAYVYQMIRAEALNMILLEIKKLPGHSGKIIELSFLQGMKNDQIAKSLGLSEKTVKNLKSIGLAILKIQLPPEIYLFLLFLVGVI